MDFKVTFNGIYFIVIIIAFIVLLILVFKYFNERKEAIHQAVINKLKYEGDLKDRELQIEKMTADAKGVAQDFAAKQFEEWKNQELETHRKVIISAAAQQVQSEVAQWKIIVDKEIRQDAVKRSMGVNFGKITEHLVPFSTHLMEFDPRDIRFIGSPVDLMIFDGATKKADVIDIYLVEIKTGTGQLSKKQRTIRDAIANHRVHWKPIVVPEFKWDVPDEDEGE